MSYIYRGPGDDEQPPEATPTPKGRFIYRGTDPNYGPDQGGTLPDESRSLPGDIAAALAGGLVDLAEMGARSARHGQTPEEAPLSSKIIEGTKSLQEAYPVLRPSVEARTSEPRRWIYEGTRMAIPSLGAGLPGGVAGLLVGGVPGAAFGAGTTGAAVFGIAEYDRFLEEVREYEKATGQQLDPDLVHSKALKTALVEGGFEGLSNVLDIFAAKVGGRAIEPLKAIARKHIKTGAKETAELTAKGALHMDRPGMEAAKALAGTTAMAMPGEVGTEMAQSYFETKFRNDVGLQAGDPIEAAKDVIGPTVVMTFLFGLGATGFNHRTRKMHAEALSDPKASPQDRVNAIRAVNAELGRYDKKNGTKYAEQWANDSLRAVQEGRAIGIDENVLRKYGPTPDKPKREPGAADVSKPGNIITGEGTPPPGVPPGGAGGPAAAPAETFANTGVIYSENIPAGVEEPAPIIPEQEPEQIADEFSEDQLDEILSSETNTEPSEAQVQAGNYKKGHMKLHGLDISIENPKGSVRKGVDKSGKPWENEIKHHYGYIRGTVGKDKDHLDVFLGPNLESTTAYVINQKDPGTGKFDEHKIMMGFNSREEAEQGYLDNYEEGWQGLGSIVETSMDEFRAWAKGTETKKPFPETKAPSGEAISEVKGEKRGISDEVIPPEVLATFKNDETGMESTVRKLKDGRFSVQLKDLGSGNTLPTSHIFPDEERAIEDAQRSAGVETSLKTPEVAPEEPKDSTIPEKTEEARGAEAEKTAAPKRRAGKSTTVRTEAGTKAEVQYAVVDAADLITSHDTDLSPNENYPQELQPRDRERAASREQILRILSGLDPELLGENPKASDGAPVVGSDNVVESGNGRTIALKLGYEKGHDRAKGYKKWLSANAERFGLDKRAIASLDNPVLVRVRTSEIDRVKFAQEANVSGQAAMSPVEIAVNDAKILIDSSILTEIEITTSGDINTAKNTRIIRDFISRVAGKSEIGNYVTKEGMLSQAAITRMRNALFAAAYGNTSALEVISESIDDDARNISRGLLIAAPAIARVKVKALKGAAENVDITPLIVKAAEKYRSIKESGETIEEYLGQLTMFGGMDPATSDILKMFEENKRSGIRIGKILKSYADLWDNLGDPRQALVFGKSERPEPMELFGRAKEIVANEEGKGPSLNLFQDQAVSGQKAENPSQVQAEPEEQPETVAPAASLKPELTIEDYSDKSFVVRGNTKEHKDRIKAAGKGIFSIKLKGGPGWVFGLKQKDKVREALKDLLGETPSKQIEKQEELPKKAPAPVQPKAEGGSPAVQGGASVQEKTAEHRRDLERKGTTRVGGIGYTIQQADTGHYYYTRTEKGIRIEHGGAGPNVWSRENAIEEALKEISHDLQAEALRKTKAETPKPATADLSQKSTGELVNDIFSIINDHIGDRGSFSTKTKEIDETLYQKIKPYLVELVNRAKKKALDVKAYVMGAVDSMPEGKAKDLYEAAAARYIEEENAEESTPEKVSASGITPVRTIANNVHRALKQKDLPLFTSDQLFKWADAAFGGTMAEGTYSVKDAYDAMELGVNLFMEDQLAVPFSGKAPEIKEYVEAIKKRILGRIPTQTKRTDEMDSFQQFSTPPSLAYVANWAANIQEGEIYLEPSAGVGGIAIFGKLAGARVYVNELSKRRLSLLREIGFEGYYNEDAEILNSTLPKEVRPTVIVMNPPFSSTAGRLTKNRTEYGGKHIEQGLKRLAPGGRLVAIVGKGMADDAPAFRDWWKKIKAEYNVRANVGIDGQEYKKYGTTFDNQILVIDKTKPETNIITGKVDKVEDLVDLLMGVRDDRTSERESATVQPGVQKGTAGPQGASESEIPLQPAAGKTGSRPDRGSDNERQPGKHGRVEPVADNEGVDNGTRGNREKPGARKPGKSEQPSKAGKPDVLGDGRSPDEKDAELSNEKGIVEVLGKEHVEQITDSVYTPYKATVTLKGSKAHPANLVESAAMSAIDSRPPTYQPNIPDNVITSGKVSDAQLEAVIYAGQAHSELLPDGVTRRGFFIGDGTGVGKGREIASIIWDNWNKGRRKAVWISKNSPLFNDAKRDVLGVGWTDKHLFDFGKVKLGTEVTHKEGVAFVTYGTLKTDTTRAKGREQKVGAKRIDQLIEWLGKDFDGVIAFDEAHAMGNAISMKGKRGKTKPSAIALAGVELQKALPNARIVYVSATGATEVTNLAYASRLGLWGQRTAFPNVENFINQIQGSGIAAMEAVARDLKSMGLYLARSISYHDVTYERLDHPLAPEQREVYDELAGAWEIVLNNINHAFEMTNVTTESGKTLNGYAKASSMSKFWGTNQRFWNQIVTSMQMPSLVKSIESDMKNGHSAVLQLVNTNEAAQNRAIAALEESDSLDDLDMTPRQALMQYIQNCFPVQQYQIITDDEGNEMSVPAVDSEGNHVLNPEAEALRDELLDRLGAIRVPDGPIEIILDHFGIDKVAEVTGRTQRVVKDPRTGESKLEKRSQAKASNDANDFTSGKKKILVFSDAGGTGRSYHAGLDYDNQALRRHYLVQPGWRADNAVQGFGRTHRSNQKQAPVYILVATDLKGHKRFISSIARRLDQLGALTKGQRETGSQGFFQARDNLESREANNALDQFIRDIYRGRVDGISMAEFMNQSGLKLLDNTGQLNETAMPEMPQFMNRLLNMKIDMQEKVFNAYSERLDKTIAAAIANGSLDQGIETVRAKKTEQVHEEVVYTDDKTGAVTKYVELELTHDARLLDFAGSQGYADNGYVKNIKSGRIWALGNRRTTTEFTTGRVSWVLTARSPNYGHQVLEEKDINNPEKYEKLKLDQAKDLWDQEYGEMPKEVKERLHMITGVLLPIWDRLPSTDLRIQRIQVAGKTMIGRVIHNKDLKSTLDNLGASSSKVNMSPEELFGNILHHGYKVTLANGWTLTRRRVSGDNRIEIKGPFYAHLEEMKSYGVFTERINYETRYFAPSDKEKGVNAIKGIISTRPVVSAEPPITSKAGNEALADQLDDDARFRKKAKDPFEAFYQEKEEKYKDILAIEQPDHGIDTQDAYDKILNYEMSPKDLDSYLSGFDKKIKPLIIQDVKHAIADSIGDMIETYRYESTEEGQAIERYIDRLLAVVKKHDVSEGRVQGVRGPAGEKAGTGQVSKAGRVKQDTLFRKSSPKDTAYRDSISAAIEPILSRWKNHPDITVVNSIDELPEGLRRQAMNAGSITGAFYNDGVYLVADGLDSTDEAYKTILHEVIAHWGLRKTFGKGFDSFLSRVYQDIDKTRLQDVADQYGFDLSKKSDQLACMEEYLASLAERDERPAAWRRLVAWVRTWLMNMGFKLKTSQSDVDMLIASAIGKARRYVQDGKGYAVEGFVGGEPLLRSVESIQRANRTSRGYGAVGSKAITPRYVESIASPSDKILDFGAGKGAVHAADLRENGLNVTAYDFGSNVRDGIHDPDALSREYDIVYASNVLNVQSGKEDLIETLEEIASAVRTGGRAVFNFPGSPRFLDMDAVGLAGEIRKVFGNAPVRVGGTKAAPLFEVVKNGKGQKAVFRKAEAQTDEPLDTKSLFPEVQTRMEKARGLGKQGSVKDRALAKLEETWHSWRRHFPQLDPAKHGKFINILRLFEAVPNYSKTRARDNIKDILGKMNDREYDVFSFNVILEDLMKDLDSGLLDPENLKDGETLPFGYTSRAQVEQDLAHFKAQASKNKAVADALERRSEYVRQMREDLVHHGLLDKSKLNDPAYFHHQVLEMWALRKWTGSGVGTKDVRTHKKGWQIARTGSLRDYNTEYIESEFEVLAQGIAQIETKKTMDRIDREANIIKSLRGRARAWNESRALEIFEEKGLVEIVESQETGEIKRVTPFTPLEKQIAVGFSRLHEMASEGILEGNDEFSDVIDSLAEEGENSRVFGYLAWLLKNDAPGAMEAARIFKGIKGKEALIKSTLGDQLKTFRDLIPEGYAEWKPEPGSAWYLTNSITDKVLDQIRSGERSFDDQETRKILARGVDAVWVVPEELAATLSDFRAYKDEGPLGKASQFLISSWKQWVLINPFRVFKYNLNNMSGDFDICWAYDPKIIKNYMWKAGKDLLKYVRNQDLSPELKEELDTAFRKDVLGSGMTVHDITDITEHMALDGYLDVMAGRKVNAISRFWNTSKKYTTYRENILRLASYRYFKDRLAKGEKAYGASNRDIVDSIRNRDDRAALLARELVGDYGNLTVSGQWLRTKMIPFYSWMEINAPRYVRMFHNLPIEGEGRGNIAEALSMKTARKAVGLSAKAATLYAMIIIWNMTMARLLCGGDDPEKELSDFERRQLHLILGRREDGSIISIRMQGALSDALAWFGLENMPGDVADLATGRKTGIEQAKEMAAAAPSRIVNASHPFIKLAAEELTGYSTFPDIFHPRPIRDKLEHLARMFSLDRPYKHLTGKPTRGDWAAGEFWEDVVNLVGYSSDPGESAYFDTRSRARSFMERKGVNPGYFHADSNSKSAALYNYKRALQYGDLDVAKKFLDKYMELGGSRKGLKISVRLASPEAWVPKKYRAEFRNSLMKSDLEKYNRAMKWYREVYGGQ